MTNILNVLIIFLKNMTENHFTNFIELYTPNYINNKYKANHIKLTLFFYLSADVFSFDYFFFNISVMIKLRIKEGNFHLGSNL